MVSAPVWLPVAIQLSARPPRLRVNSAASTRASGRHEAV